MQPSYYDVSSAELYASAEVLTAILGALGDPPREDPLPPTLVVEEGRSFPLPCPMTVVLESGERRELAELPADLPSGYHRLHFDTGEGPRESFLIVCPGVMHSPDPAGRSAGIAISLYGLQSRRNWGAGDLRDLSVFAEWAAETLGASFIALNPLHAIANRQPFNTSPYLPASTYYRNFLYLDVEAVDEFQYPAVQAEFHNPDVQNELDALRNSEWVEYERVGQLKLRFLRLCFDQFPASDARFAAFLEREGPMLQRFALYCALDEHFRTTQPGTWLWTQWPAGFQHPESEACREFGQSHESDVYFYCWMQWLLDTQLEKVQALCLARGMDIGLYHDLALATDRFGCDLWADRDHFVQGCRVGAPPDGFSPEGQDWSFPPPNTARHLEDGYRLFTASIRNNARHGGALRMDHVMRLFRLFWIPEGYPARDGTYVHDRWRDLLGILALESHRLGVRIIGEDLGTITQEMRDALAHWGVLGYRVLYFESDGGVFLPPDRYTPAAVATAATHDLATLAGYWEGLDIEARRAAGLLPDPADFGRQMDDRRRDRQALLDRLHELGLLDEGTPADANQIAAFGTHLRDACWNLLAATPCQLFVVNQEEIFLERYQQNLPGSTREYPNWRRKMRVPVEELAGNPDVVSSADALRGILERHGRKR